MHAMSASKVVMLAIALLALPVRGQDHDPELDVERTRVVPPALRVNGEPNADYAAQLEARVKELRPGERKAFFKHLRKQQRDLARRVEEMIFHHDKTLALRRDISGEGTGISRKAGDLVEQQRRTILALKQIQADIERIRKREDPQRIDAMDFQADFYAGLQFSSLYSEGDQNNSFFSTSKPFVSLDLRNTLRWPGGERWMDVFGTLSFQSASKENSDTVKVITTSGNFKGEVGLWYMEPMTETVSWGLIGRVGLVGYGTPQSGPDFTTANRDEFRSTFTLGFTMRQEEGPMRTSFAEIAFVRDPLFVHPNRLMVRGQVVLTQFGSRGANGDFYIEGRASKGRSGRDEATLVLGLRLSTISFFRSLGGG